LTTGRRPFQGATLAAIFRAITQDTPEAPHVLDSTVPVPLSDLIMKLLAKDPARRFASGDDLIHALQDCLRPQSSTLKESPDRIPQKQQRGIGRKVLISGLVGLVIIIGLGGYYFFRQQPSTPITSRDQNQQSTSSPPSADLPQSRQSTEGKVSSPPIKPNLDQQEMKGPQQENKTVRKQVDTDPERKNQPTQVMSTLSPQDLGKKNLLEKQTLLKMDSRPSGADLYIDGSHIGKTPVNLTIVSGKHEVKLKLDKYLGWEAQLDLSKGGEVPLSIQLLPERPTNP